MTSTQRDDCAGCLNSAEGDDCTADPRATYAYLSGAVETCPASEAKETIMDDGWSDGGRMRRHVTLGVERMMAEAIDTRDAEIARLTRERDDALALLRVAQAEVRRLEVLEVDDGCED